MNNPNSATQEADLRRSSGRRPQLAIKIGITVALLALLFWQVKWQDIWRSLQDIDLPLFLITVLLTIPTQYFQFAKWDLLAREAGPGVSRGDIHRGYWVGYTLGLITPGRIGQYGRALALRNCSLARAAGLTFIERTYSALLVNGLGLISFVLLPRLGWMSELSISNHWAEAALMVSGCSLLAIGIFPQIIAPALIRLLSKLPYGDKLARAASAIEVVSVPRGIWLLVLAALGLGTSVLQFVLLLWALGSSVPLLAGMMAGFLTFFIKGSIPIAVGNLGVGEWTAIICLAGLGVPSSIAVSASLMLFTLNVFLPGMVGLPFISSLRAPSLSVASRAAQ